jgi:hypothetical protein
LEPEPEPEPDSDEEIDWKFEESNECKRVKKLDDEG